MKDILLKDLMILKINWIKSSIKIINILQKNKGLDQNIDKEISNNILIESAVKIMKLMIPFTPHLALECLEVLKSKTFDDWPIIEKSDDTIDTIALEIENVINQFSEASKS